MYTLISIFAFVCSVLATTKNKFVLDPLLSFSYTFWSFLSLVQFIYVLHHDVNWKFIWLSCMLNYYFKLYIYIHTQLRNISFQFGNPIVSIASREVLAWAMDHQWRHHLGKASLPHASGFFTLSNTSPNFKTSKLFQHAHNGDYRRL